MDQVYPFEQYAKVIVSQFYVGDKKGLATLGVSMWGEELNAVVV